MNSQPIEMQQSIPFDEGFELDLRPRRLRRGSRVLKLERIPLEILLLLLERPGQVLTRDQIVDRIWGKGVSLDTDNSIRGAIRKIRQALNDDPEQPRFIQTVTGRGYRFIAPVISRLPEDMEERAAPQEPKVAAWDAPPPPPESLLPAPDRHEVRHLRAYRWPALALAALVALAGIYLLLRKHPAAKAAPQISSLAVLPLKNLSGDPAQDYFADAMTEAVIGRLSAIRGLRVISHTSVMQFKDAPPSLPEIGRTLGADAIVEGSVIRDGNRVRVHAQLIRAATDEHIWSEEYDRQMSDVLTLQSDIAQSVAEKVKVTVTGDEHARLAAARQVSPEVYEDYLKGVYANYNTQAGIEQSIDYFQAAINKDPTFAPAYMTLANAYGNLGSVYGGVSPKETRPKLLDAAKKALELDPELAGAHVLLGGLYQKEWRWQQSEGEFRRALELDPNDPDAYRELGSWLICQGRPEEAVALLRRARDLDPLGVVGLAGNGLLLYHARHYDESIETLRSVLAVRPDYAPANWFLGYALIAKGQPEQAIPVLEKAVQLSDRSPAVIGVLVRAYAHAGRREDALRLVDELKRRNKEGYVAAGAFINAYLGLGDTEQAFVWLERAYQEKSPILQFLKAHPHFDSIRDDPRFGDLIRRVGLDQQVPVSM